MQNKRLTNKKWLRRAAPLAALVIGLLVVRVYVTQVVELVRLRSWRDELISENAAIERQIADLSYDLERHHTDAWVVEQLHAMGRVASDEVRVRPIPMVPEVMPTATPTPSLDVARPMRDEGGIFRNEIWEAWKELFTGTPRSSTRDSSPFPDQ